MKKQVLAVTGGSGALGTTVVDMARSRGALVGCIDLAEAWCSETPDFISLGGVDLRDPTKAQKAVDTVAEHFSGLDALINLAGGFSFERIVESSSQSWLRLFELNVVTTLNACRAGIPHLVKSHKGSIVNVGAQRAERAGAGMGPYAAAKTSVHRLTEALAAEFKGKIIVNAVLPSTIDTSANRDNIPDGAFKKWVRPDELAEVILFLASSAAMGITGALIPVNGRL